MKKMPDPALLYSNSGAFSDTPQGAAVRGRGVAHLVPHSDDRVQGDAVAAVVAGVARAGQLPGDVLRGVLTSSGELW